MEALGAAKLRTMDQKCLALIAFTDVALRGPDIGEEIMVNLSKVYGATLSQGMLVL
jgi:hypothetical protein